MRSSGAQAARHVPFRGRKGRGTSRPARAGNRPVDPLAGFSLSFRAAAIQYTAFCTLVWSLNGNCLTLSGGGNERLDVEAQGLAFSDLLPGAHDRRLKTGRRLVFPPVHPFAVAPYIFVRRIERPVSVVLKPLGPLFRRHAVAEVLLGVGLPQGEVLIHVKRLPGLDLPIVPLAKCGWHQATCTLADGMVRAEVLLP